MITQESTDCKARHAYLRIRHTELEGALPEAAFCSLLRDAGFTVEALVRGRNARTGHPANSVLTFRATQVPRR